MIDFLPPVWQARKPIVLRGTTGVLALPVPKSAQWVAFIIKGPGGNGGNGFTGAAASARGGGGGGGGGATLRALVPASAFRGSILYALGAPGTATSIYAERQATAAILSANSGANGGNGTASAAGALGAGSGTGNTPGFGFVVLSTGGPGIAGGAHTGANATSSNGQIMGISNGAPGGGGTTSADFTGGGFTALAPLSSIGSTPAGSNNGVDGLLLDWAFSSTPGTGGGSSNTGVGGNGGDGGPGSGGGGGGGGTTGGTGGRGGPGIMWVWFL